MSEQIREQVSAFLDGELPSSETELLLKRLMRDAELRESFGRYALIGESMRGTAKVPITRGFAARVNGAIDGGPADGGSAGGSGPRQPLVAAFRGGRGRRRRRGGRGRRTAAARRRADAVAPLCRSRPRTPSR